MYCHFILECTLILAVLNGATLSYYLFRMGSMIVGFYEEKFRKLGGRYGLVVLYLGRKNLNHSFPICLVGRPLQTPNLYRQPCIYKEKSQEQMMTKNLKKEGVWGGGGDIIVCFQ